jgi:hypothetical protein
MWNVARASGSSTLPSDSVPPKAAGATTTPPPFCPVSDTSLAAIGANLRDSHRASHIALQHPGALLLTTVPNERLPATRIPTDISPGLDTGRPGGFHKPRSITGHYVEKDCKIDVFRLMSSRAVECQSDVSAIAISRQSFVPGRVSVECVWRLRDWTEHDHDIVTGCKFGVSARRRPRSACRRS